MVLRGLWVLAFVGLVGFGFFVKGLAGFVKGLVGFGSS